MLIKFQELRAKYNLKSTGVLHVGGHYAEEIDDYYNNGINKSIWVEADPTSYAILQEKVKGYKDAVAFNACISNTDGNVLTFNISNNEGQSSSIFEFDYHKIAHAEVEFIDKISLKTKRLDTLLNANNIKIEDYSFLNFDIQGAELIALMGLGDLLNKVEALYLEINEKSLYKGCPLVADIDKYLCEYGFDRVETAMCGDFGWGDAFYIRKEQLLLPDNSTDDTVSTSDASEPIGDSSMTLEQFKEQKSKQIFSGLTELINKGADRYALKHFAKEKVKEVIHEYDLKFRKTNY